jgi:hypothetical protein
MEVIRQSVLWTTGPVFVFGRESRNDVQKNGRLFDQVLLIESPEACGMEDSLIAEASHWAGVHAALEFPND